MHKRDNVEKGLFRCFAAAAYTHTHTPTHARTACEWVGKLNTTGNRQIQPAGVVYL